MRFYTGQHQFYCGVDLHAKSLSLCVLNQAGQVVLAETLKADGRLFLEKIAPFRADLVVGCECMFCWYWFADLCLANHLSFALGHAMYMKAIHGGKAKNDRIDADKIARLLRGGNLPIAYVYPKGMRETRDLLRRRTYLVHKRSEAVTHIRNTHSQYNLSACEDQLTCASSRDAEAIARRFTDPSVRQSVRIDLRLLDHYDELILEVEKHLIRTAEVQNHEVYARLRTIAGVGKILGLVLMYELHDIGRFAGVGDFLSYARLVRCVHESAGKKQGTGGKKIGNAHLRWAFAEAAVLFIRHSERAKTWMEREARRRGSKGKALGILAARLGRSVYHLLRKEEDFDEDRFWGSRGSRGSRGATSNKNSQSSKDAARRQSSKDAARRQSSKDAARRRSSKDAARRRSSKVLETVRR